MLDDDKLVVVRGLSHGFSANGAAAAAAVVALQQRW